MYNCVIKFFKKNTACSCKPCVYIHKFLSHKAESQDFNPLSVGFFVLGLKYITLWWAGVVKRPVHLKVARRQKKRMWVALGAETGCPL